MLKIRITDPLGNSAKYALPDEEGTQYVLGRAEDCDVVLVNDGSLSRHHALLTYEGSRWCIQDNNSVNGIRLGEVPVLYTALVPGAVYLIGNTQLEVLSAGSVIPAVPPAPPQQMPEAAPVTAAGAAPAEEPQQEPEAAQSENAPEASPTPAAEPLPEPVALPPRHRSLRRPEGAAKAAPRALRNGKGETVKRGEKKEKRALPPARALKHIAGAEEAAKSTPKRRMRSLEEVEPPVGSPPDEALGLPVDFELQFFLSEPRHAVTEGSLLRFGLVSACDCSVFLVQHDSVGGICLLVPGTVKGRAELRAGKATALPPKGVMAADELVAAAPYGRDTVVAVVCTSLNCRFAHHLQALLQGDTPPPARPGEVEKMAIDLCRAEMAENPPRWSASVLCVETFPAGRR